MKLQTCIRFLAVYMVIAITTSLCRCMRVPKWWKANGSSSNQSSVLILHTSLSLSLDWMTGANWNMTSVVLLINVTGATAISFNNATLISETYKTGAFSVHSFKLDLNSLTNRTDMYVYKKLTVKAFYQKSGTVRVSLIVKKCLHYFIFYYSHILDTIEYITAIKSTV